MCGVSISSHPVRCWSPERADCVKKSSSSELRGQASGHWQPAMDPHSSSRSQALANYTNYTKPSSLSSSSVKLEALEDVRCQIFLIILYSLTAITSFILNAITVIVLARYRHSELRKYLINLSMSDVLMSLLSIRKFCPNQLGLHLSPRLPCLTSPQRSSVLWEHLWPQRLTRAHKRSESEAKGLPRGL